MPTWKDVTPITPDGRRVDAQAAWVFCVPDARILVHRWMSEKGWFGSCYQLGETRYHLASLILEDAQAEFLNYLVTKAQRLFIELSKVVP